MEIKVNTDIIFDCEENSAVTNITYKPNAANYVMLHINCSKLRCIKVPWLQ